jgi:hypothetical protein
MLMKPDSHQFDIMRDLVVWHVKMSEIGVRFMLELQSLRCVHIY